MKIYIEKVAMIRPLTNPKNCDLDLEMDCFKINLFRFKF